MRQIQIAPRLARHAAGAALLIAAAGSAWAAEPITRTPAPTTLTLDDLPPGTLRRLVEQTASVVLPRHEAMLQDLDNCDARGLPVPALCFAEGTPDDVVEAFQAALARRQGYGPRFWSPVRWGPTALDPTSAGQTGTPTVITYSFVPDGAMLPDGVGEGDQPSDLKAVLDDRYGDRAVWLALYAQVFARWSELIGVRYVYEPNDDGAPFPFSPGVPGIRGDVRLSGKGLDGNAGVLAYNYFPDLGDMVLDT